METVAIIPARGHSKGILRKNLRILAGKPLVAHSIEVALSSRIINRVIVSTDDPEIESVSKKYGASVIIRPAELSSDTSSSEDAILHTLAELEKKDDYHSDLTVFLQCTSPLTKTVDIDSCIKLLIDQKADTALTVSDFHYFIWKKDKNGQAAGINHDKSIRNMRQERQNQFIETGAVYVMRTKGFKLHRHRFFGKTVMSHVPLERCLEIDELVDLYKAEAIINIERSKENLEKLPQHIKALILDFDGVFTDNRVIVDQKGNEAVICSRGDGMGLEKIKKKGIKIAVMSTEKNPAVQTRCQKLGIECFHSLDRKDICMKNWLNKANINRQETIYVGNDINDLECMSIAGCSVAVHDAHRDVINAANIVLSSKGGQGAIRELTELLEKKLGGNP